MPGRCHETTTIAVFSYIFWKVIICSNWKQTMMGLQHRVECKFIWKVVVLPIYSLNKIWAWAFFEQNLTILWTKFEHSLNKIWALFKQNLSILWTKFEHFLNKIWALFKQNLSIPWTKFEHYLNKIWALFEKNWALLKQSLSILWTKFEQFFE